jgi:hypothetical protein
LPSVPALAEVFNCAYAPIRSAAPMGLEYVHLKGMYCNSRRLPRRCSE